MPIIKIVQIDRALDQILILSGERGAIACPIWPVLAALAAQNPAYVPFHEGTKPAEELIGKEIECDDETIRVLSLTQ